MWAREPPPPLLPPLAPMEEEGARPMRVGGRWRPRSLIEEMGRVRSANESLPRLLVACAIIEGPHRVFELASWLEQHAARASRRIDQMLRDPQLVEVKLELQTVAEALKRARTELPGTKARAANDRDGGFAGLVLYDFDLLIHYAAAVILATELGAMRNLTGVDRAKWICREPPDLHLAELWVERLMPSSPLKNIQLYNPPELGRRVVVVFHDGRLAYDPAPFEEDEESYDEDEAWGGDPEAYDEDWEAWRDEDYE